MRFNFRACIQPIVHVKAPALAIECQTSIGYNTAACHRIEYKVTLMGKIIQYVCNHLGGDPSGPIVTETLVTNIPVPMIPWQQAPHKCFKSLKIIFVFQRNGPDKGLRPPPSTIFRTYGAGMLFSDLWDSETLR